MQEHEITMTEPTELSGPPGSEVRQQLNRMLQCRLFKHSPRLSRFFTFTVEQALAGADQRLKEYSIALEVFGKPETFDPRMDSAVRVAARQLRAKIDLYYLTEGARDGILVRYRPGDYIPKFYYRNDAPAFQYLEREVEIRRPAVLVEKDRTAVRMLTECLDQIGYPIGGVEDSAEGCLKTSASLGPCVVLTGVNLMGSLDGPGLTRELHERSGAVVIAVIPEAIEAPLLEQVALSQPDAVLYCPVRMSDLRAAMRLALARRASARVPEMVLTEA